ISDPSVTLLRDEDGVLHASGLRIGGIEPPATAEVMDGNAAEPGNLSVAVEAAPVEATEDGSEATTPTTMLLERVSLAGLRVAWTDRSVTPAVETAFTAQMEGTSIDLSGAEDAATIQLHLESTIEGALDALALDVEAALQGERQRLSATLAMESLRAGSLSPYLPAGLEVTLDGGQLRTQITAAVDPATDGGQAVEARIADFDYRDQGEAEPLLAFDALELSAPRLDGPGAFFEIATLALEGLSFEAEKVAQDRIEVLGLALVTPPQEDGAAPDRPEPSRDAEVQDEAPESTSADAAAPSASAPAPAAASASAPAPTVKLGRLDLGIDRLRYVDRTRADAVPLDLSLALVTPGPQVLCQPDPEDLPAIEFSAVGALQPIVGGIEFSTALEPFAADPGAGFRVLIDKITGAQLAAISPEVAAQIDPTGFVDGSFEITGDTRLSFARRGPLDFSLARGFGATLNIDRFALKATPDAEPTGFDRLDVEVKRVDPATGNVRISSIDLGGIYARVEQAEEGMRIAGLLLPSPPADPDQAAEPAESPQPSMTDADPEEDAAAADAPPPAEIAIDRLTVSGLDFEFLDSTTEPALRLPIEDLQLEVQRFTTRTLIERRPFSFRAVVDAGEVELQERTGADNLLFGVLGSAASAVTLSSEGYETEQRRVWDLLETSGRLSLGPELRGRVQLALLGLELPAFRGAARGAGVDIGDGLLDNRTTIRFRDDGGIGVDAKTTTSYLSLSEPPGGPISEYLKLPAPLDTVLFLLRNEDGEQKLPVRLDVPKEGVSMGQIAGLAANTLGVLITDAVSSAPLRVLGPLGSVAGALGLTSEPLSADTVTLEFADGAATMAASKVVPSQLEGETTDRAKTPLSGDPIEAIALALRGNPDLRVVVQADLGEADLEVAQRLANPPRDTILSLIGRQRDRKAAIERERAILTAKARARIFAGAAANDSDGFGSAPRADEDLTARLQSLDAERAAVERALDELFGYIRPGAERRADMRTRNAALALAQERLDRVRLDLVRRVCVAVATRIDVRRARFRKSTEKNPLPARGIVTITPN
ncbi:MAG: DUF748 domain-containing protein, partial [Planctomycetota bacterium]